MIKGEWIIYEDGIEVARTENVVTINGKREILGMIAGSVPKAGQIVYGSGDAEALDTDESLQFPFGKEAVIFAVPIYDGLNSKVVFKARLRDGVAGEIREIGLSNSQISESPIFFVFDGSEDLMIDGSPAESWDESNTRVGANSVELSTGEVLTATRTLSIYGAAPQDELVLAGWSDTAATAVTLTLYDKGGNSTSASYTLGTGYTIDAATIAEFSDGGSGFDWSEIVKVEATTATGGATMALDALTIRSVGVFGDLISRAVYLTPVVKRSGSRMDIEYELTINLS